MKLKFDSGLPYQADAIASVVDLFEGLPSKQGAFEVSLGASDFMGTTQNELGIGHQLALSPGALLANLNTVQERNVVSKSDELFGEKDPY